MRRVRKKKFSTKKTIKIILPLLLLLIIIINFNNIKIYYQSKKTGYEFKTINTFHELNVYDKIKNKSYSKLLERIITTEYYNPIYLDSYIDIENKDIDNYLENINLLLNIGYTASDINNIYSQLSEESINTLLKNDYLKDISNILKLNYFHENNLKRYLSYSKEKNITYENLITYVNIGLDKEYYKDVNKIENTSDILILVNKFNMLPSNYVPSDLEAINNKYNKGYNNKLRHDARVAFEEMCEAALKDNIVIYSGSAYRSYDYQLNLYNRYVSIDGKTKAETYSARAGYSEHQTGLATDILNGSLEYISSNHKEYTWLINNSYKYGFNLRYPKDKENITGYMYEEWHFRYLGKEVATYLYENNLTYDEFVARNIKL